MVMLEQQANVFKNYAFQDTERLLVPGGGSSIQLVDPTKWSNMCPTKQVARLRAAAGVPSYLNNFNVSIIDLHKIIGRKAHNLWTGPTKLQERQYVYKKCLDSVVQCLYPAQPSPRSQPRQRKRTKHLRQLRASVFPGV